jgi:hypothetical protein
MAKPLGPKSLLIRDAINAHPDKSPKELAEMINSSPARKEDRLEVKPAEISQQKQVMKKAGATPATGTGTKGRGKGGRQPATAGAGTATAAPARPAAVAAANPVDLIDKALDLAQQCGSVAALKRLVDRLADMQRW